MLTCLELVGDVPATRCERYQMLGRIHALAQARTCDWVGFGLRNDRIRLVARGGDLEEWTRRFRQGASRLGYRLEAPHVTERPSVGALIWAHATEGDPLADPWTSHRDWLGFRRAPFFRPPELGIPEAEVHRRLGGAAVPKPRTAGHPREPIGRLWAVAAATRGVCPSDRRCFRLFVQLADARGWSTLPIAQALLVSSRRVRQLKREEEPSLPRSLAALAHPPLGVLP